MDFGRIIKRLAIIIGLAITLSTSLFGQDLHQSKIITDPTMFLRAIENFDGISSDVIYSILDSCRHLLSRTASYEIVTIKETNADIEIHFFQITANMAEYVRWDSNKSAYKKGILEAQDFFILHYYNYSAYGNHLYHQAGCGEPCSKTLFYSIQNDQVIHGAYFEGEIKTEENDKNFPNSNLKDLYTFVQSKVI